jgi:hypothetical protein
MTEFQPSGPFATLEPSTAVDPHRTIGEEILMLIARLPPQPARSEGRMD